MTVKEGTGGFRPVKYPKSVGKVLTVPVKT